MANIQKSQKNLARLSSILGQEGAESKTPGIFYKAVVQAVLVFGSETWFMKTCIDRTLVDFHHWVSHCLVVKLPGMRYGGTSLCMRQWHRQGWRMWILILPATRTWLHSTFQSSWSCTCLCLCIRSGSMEQVFPSGGGEKIFWSGGFTGGGGEGGGGIREGCQVGYWDYDGTLIRGEWFYLLMPSRYVS